MYRKILNFIYAFVITIFLSACSDSTINPDDTNESSSPAAATNTSSETSAEENMPVVATKEILDADYCSGLIQIDKHLIQLPVTLNELLDMGFDCMVTTSSTGSVLNPSSYNDKMCLISPDESYNFAIVYNGEIITSKTYVNKSQKIQTITEINPTIYYLEFFSDRNFATKVWLPGGITLGAHYSNIESIYGTPRYLDSTHMRYHYGVTSQQERTNGITLDTPNVGMIIEVDKATQTINYLEIGKSADFSTFDSFTEKTLPISNLLDRYPKEFTTLIAPNYFTDKNIVPYMLIEHEGQKYILWFMVQFTDNTTLLPNDLEPLYSVIEENGTKRELQKRVLADNQYLFRVEIGDYALIGFIFTKDLSEPVEQFVTDDRFLDKMIEIVDSINY